MQLSCSVPAVFKVTLSIRATNWICNKLPYLASIYPPTSDLLHSAVNLPPFTIPSAWRVCLQNRARPDPCLLSSLSSNVTIREACLPVKVLPLSAPPPSLWIEWPCFLSFLPLTLAAGSHTDY